MKIWLGRRSELAEARVSRVPLPAARHSNCTKRKYPAGGAPMEMILMD